MPPPRSTSIAKLALSCISTMTIAHANTIISRGTPLSWLNMPVSSTVAGVKRCGRGSLGQAAITTHSDAANHNVSGQSPAR